MIVEYRLPVLFQDSIIQKTDDDGELMWETRTGNLLTWGLKTFIDEETKQAITNTVAIVEDSDGGSVISLDPEELKII